MWYAYVIQDLFLHMKCGEERKLWLDAVILFKKVNVSDQGKWLTFCHFYSNNGNEPIFVSNHIKFYVNVENIFYYLQVPWTISL